MYKYLAIFVFIALVQSAVIPPATEVTGNTEKTVEPATEKHVEKKTEKKPEPIAILSQKSDVSPEGSYQWSFEAADGTKAEQTAEIKPVGNETVAEDIHGSYTYVDPDGKTHSLQYTANEYGFFPKGDDIFSEIARHLSALEANPPPITKTKLEE